MKPDAPLNDAQRAQIRAADPHQSSWVAANAGSGKTRVLTDRVARLLLSGTEPQRILCLTYTKAAAAEMQTRLFGTLGKWSMLGDAELLDELGKLAGDTNEVLPEHLPGARRLFARALETPGGLKIQTIHAFCEALLRRFPLEAGVAPQFQVLDARQARAMREELLDRIAEEQPEVMAELAGYIIGEALAGLLAEIGKHRFAFAWAFDEEAFAEALGVEPGLTMGDLLAQTVLPGDMGLLRALIPILSASGKTDQGAARKLSACLELGPEDRLPALEQVFLTGAGAKEPFSAKTNRFPTKAVQNAHPDLTARLEPLMLRVEAVRPRRLDLAAYQKSRALHRFARVWLAYLDRRKASQGLLDFDDMIERTRRLLSDPASASWVLWKLDGGLDHILVDEAQDTSPAQWQVVRSLSEEFFAGEGARGPDRTVFVVGDEKQSIYSFQGADPAAFGEMHDYFARMLEGITSQLQDCALIHSFRSAKPVLDLVDAVFDGPAGEGLDRRVRHQAFKDDLPGRVEVWPFLPNPERAEEPPWYAPVDARGPEDPVNVLADQIAARIGGWLRGGTVLPGEKPKDDRPVRAGDVMILVQRRNALFHAIIRALKRARVPVAGADVLRVGAELAVKDLLACLRIAATPADDLSLAALLRSPLGGVSEEDLFDLAHGRKERLWAELRAQEAEPWVYARALVSDLLGQADYLRPFELLQRILIRHDGRRRLVARLGPEADDGIDALLDQALAYEQTEAPSLSGFLSWIDRDELQIKRRVDEGTDQVRVMTVHGAKGLEAPIVILPDTVDRSEARNAPEIWMIGGDLPVWRMPAGQQPAEFEAAEEARRAQARAENMRLLYVALTRAERCLIVCGAGSEPKGEGNSWYRLTAEAMAGLGARAVEGPDGETLVLTHGWRGGEAAASPGETVPEVQLPDWAVQLAPKQAAGAAVVSPSDLGGAHVIPGAEAADGDAAALERGDYLHRLLEVLSEAPEERWGALVTRVLPPELADAHTLADEARRVLTSEAAPEVFGPDSLAEVDVSGLLPDLGGVVLRGRIDRLVVRPDMVLAVDFKSNRVVPERPGEVPEAILRQMGAYRAALRQIWTDRAVETAILWTREARLMRLPVNVTDEALARAGRLDPMAAGT